MKLAAARAIIESAPRTHLGEAARAVLKLLDDCDPARLEAAEAQHSVFAEALAVAREEAEQLDHQLTNVQQVVAKSRLEVFHLQTQLRDSIDARDRLARELEEARQPDPEGIRLRSLEYAVEKLVTARPPMRAEGRAAYDYIVSHLTPYLAEPKVGA